MISCQQSVVASLYHPGRVVVFLREAGLLSVQGMVGVNLGWVVTLARAKEGFQKVFDFPIAPTSSELVVLAEKIKEVFKSVLLHILRHLSEQEPVTVRSVPTDIGHRSPVVVRLPEHEDPDLREHEADKSVDDGHGAADSKDDVPVPQHQVDLLVDNVEGQYAHGVVVLDAATDSVLVELTLGHLGEGLVHWVPVPVRSSDLSVTNMIRHPGPVVEESSLQEDVSHVDLQTHVGQVENLHKKESAGVASVLLPEF